MSELLKKVFWSSRPVSWINTAYPFAAAYFINTHRLDDVFWLGTLFFLIPYNVLMYGINDVFDYESDLRNPRKGGIEGALLDPKFHRPMLLISSLLPVPFVAFLVWRGTVDSDLWLALFLFTVVAYSAKGLRFKERPLLDSFTSASHFVGPMIFGLAIAGVDMSTPMALALIFAFVFWGVASHAFGAVQDVKADREANIASIATYFGARATTRFAWAAYLVSGLLMITTGWPSLLASVAAVPYLVIVAPHLNITDENCESANAGWKNFIWLNYLAGFVVTMLLIYGYWRTTIL